MKTFKIILATLFAIVMLQSVNAQSDKSQRVESKKTDIEQAFGYSCPMHPDVMSATPGKCPKCGSAFVINRKGSKQVETTSYSCPMHPNVVSQVQGKCTKCGSQLVADRRGSKQVTTVYTCSMHPEEVSNKTGKCSKCGMELTEVKAKTKPTKG
ncbi:heavy metal-binding domain-containing protein [Parasediminibacterium paludis]|jgi:predicted RNA-binding Zn-ribbon protein involved in translation (DUF1610 family)|uniref:Heavy metal-binding domain-containing protein n=1 Tax=Parasediminibacterium paludis TaxID=908966 RepID=A0ABV8Q0J7_9BACT